jgi:hypothetical protein
MQSCCAHTTTILAPLGSGSTGRRISRAVISADELIFSQRPNRSFPEIAQKLFALTFLCQWHFAADQWSADRTKYRLAEQLFFSYRLWFFALLIVEMN